MRRFTAIKASATAVVLSLSSILSLALAPAAFAAGAPYTCTWTGGGTDAKFSTAANWSGCNSTAPVAGDADNFVFDNTSLSANATPNNDITSLTLGNVSFTGTGTHTFTLSGNTLSVGGNLTDSSAQNNTINNNIVFTGTNTLNVASGGVLAINGNVNGTGALTKTGAGGVNMFGQFNLTGAVADNNGSMAISAGSTDASFSSLTLGANADFYFDVFSQSGAGTSFTMTKPVTTSGGTLYLKSATVLSSAHTVNLTSAYSLNANAYLSAADNITAHVQGPLSGTGFVLGAAGLGTVINESSNNTSATPSGTLTNNTTSLQGGAAGGADGGLTDTTATPAAAAPATPDTGLALVAAHPLTSLITSTIAAGTLFFTARRMKPAARR